MEFGTPARFWHPSPAPTKSAAVPGLGLFPMQGRDHHPLTDGMRESAARGMLCLLRRRDAPARSPQDPVKSMVTPINTSPTSLGFWVPTALRDRVLQKFSRSGRRTRKWILARTIPWGRAKRSSLRQLPTSPNSRALFPHASASLWNHKTKSGVLTFHLLRPARNCSHFRIQRSSFERQRDLNPIDQCAAQHTTRSPTAKTSLMFLPTHYVDISGRRVLCACFADVG